MANTRQDGLAKAKKGQADEFYTQYSDIQKEVNAYLEFDPNTFRNKTVLLPCDDPEWSNFTRFFAQNFETFGLKKLISTSYAAESKRAKYGSDDVEKYHQLTLFEYRAEEYDEELSKKRGKIFVLDRDSNHSGKIDIDDLEWHYLHGDGDFQSSEVRALRDEADIIVTNPPFSLFCDFLAWILEANKKFLIIGNINCITYQEVFPRIMRNEIWLGNGMGRWISGFIVPESYGLYGTEARIEDGQRIVATNNCLWLTNLDHGRRHQPLQLMTMADNLKFSRHNKIRENGYKRYDFYDAIEVPFSDAIPSDFDGLMGVPITFLDKYNPKQFEILGCSYSYGDPGEPYHKPGDSYSVTIEGENIYKRIFIRRRNNQ
ncbi:MAG: adenine-specific methyltransferase EcoRI family protein [Clostridiales bacterium]|nr:adenine-specific methyltransferase EcoRI family protein [Clostridiales bacterium]